MYDGQRPLNNHFKSTEKPYQVGKNPYLHRKQFLHQNQYQIQKISIYTKFGIKNKKTHVFTQVFLLLKSRS